MALPIQAISKFRPRIKKRGLARKRDISRWMADRTLLTEGQARAVFSDFSEAAKFYLLNRQDVELEGLGRVILDINLAGELTLNIKFEADFMEQINADFDKGSEAIENADNIGLTSSQVYDLWDSAYPDNLVERS